jgi:hypothetical protein
MRFKDWAGLPLIRHDPYPDDPIDIAFATIPSAAFGGN